MPLPKPEPYSDDELRWVTCSLCGLDALGESMRQKPTRLPKQHRKTRHIVVRVYGRPRCNECVNKSVPQEDVGFVKHEYRVVQVHRGIECRIED